MIWLVRIGGYQWRWPLYYPMIELSKFKLMNDCIDLINIQIIYRRKMNRIFYDYYMSILLYLSK